VAEPDHYCKYFSAPKSVSTIKHANKRWNPPRRFPRVEKICLGHFHNYNPTTTTTLSSLLLPRSISDVIPRIASTRQR